MKIKWFQDPIDPQHLNCLWYGGRLFEIKHKGYTFIVGAFGDVQASLIAPDTGEMIGDCGLTLQSIDGELLPEIGYHIRRDCQHKGYAKEAAKAVRDWAFRNTGYPALYSYCKYTNEPSIRTAESIGMRFDCEYPDKANGITHVSMISRKDWLSKLTKG